MLKTYLQGVTGFDVRAHVITNGHTDPLHGVGVSPDIVLLHFEAKRTAELSAWAARPVDGRPILIVVGPGGDGDATRLAIRSGARDFLPEPVGSADLIATLQQVRAELRARATQGLGTIHAFVGASGGAGSSFIAANIAHVLAAHARRHTALIDLDLNFSPTAHHLNLLSQRGLLEALEEHLGIKRVLADLLKTDADDQTFDAKIKVLKETVSHHVEEEESDLFPKVRKLFDKERREALGQEMSAEQAELEEAGNARKQVPGETDQPATI